MGYFKMLLAAKKLTKHFINGHALPIRAVNEVDFEIAEGEFVCILGPNGSGKTTILRLINKELLPTSGSLHYEQHDLSLMNNQEWHRHIGIIYQNPGDGLAQQLTVEENLLLAIEKGKRSHILSSVYRKNSIDAIKQTMDKLSLGFDIQYHQLVEELSGGQKQLLSILMAYLQSPRILLLDEPTASLDPRNASRVMEVISRWHSEQNICCILVTHQIDLAIRTRSRLLILNSGTLTQDISPEKAATFTPNTLRELLVRDGFNLSGTNKCLTPDK